MSDEFRAYASDPSADPLIRLLRSVQDRVYRVCYQVLRRAHDAEDAAQESLIRIAKGARSIGDAEAFRRWVYRVALNSALEFARKSARRRLHESRAAMPEPPPPLDDETRRALFEAIERLDDRDRAVLLDHYVEGETLVAIGAREGVTPQAVSKRLDRAREDLRKALPASLVAMLDFNRLFERAVPPPDLVSGPVLKAAAAAGGAAMSLKTSILAGAILVLAVAGAAIGTRRGDEAAPNRPSPVESKSVELEGAISTTARGPVNVVKEPARPSFSSKALEARLIRFREWRAAFRAEYEKRRPEFLENQKAELEFVGRKQEERIHELEGVRDLILADPDAFFLFLKDPENAACIPDLCEIAFRQYHSNPGGTPWSSKFESGSLPSKIVDGFAQLLEEGGPEAKRAALGFFDNFLAPPPSFSAQWPGAIQDVEPEVAKQALGMVWHNSTHWPLMTEVRDAVLKVGRTSPDLEVRREAATALGIIPGPEAQSLLLERMETVKNEYELSSVVCAMSGKFLEASRGGEPVDEGRFLQASLRIVERDLEEGYHKLFVGAALYLAPSKSRMVVQRAMAAASDADRTALAAVLRELDKGVNDRDKLNALLWQK